MIDINSAKNFLSGHVFSFCFWGGNTFQHQSLGNLNKQQALIIIYLPSKAVGMKIIFPLLRIQGSIFHYFPAQTWDEKI